MKGMKRCEKCNNANCSALQSVLNSKQVLREHCGGLAEMTTKRPQIWTQKATSLCVNYLVSILNLLLLFDISRHPQFPYIRKALKELKPARRRPLKIFVPRMMEHYRQIWRQRWLKCKIHHQPPTNQPVTVTSVTEYYFRTMAPTWSRFNEKIK